MLELSQWGIRNVNDLTWMTPPPAGAVSQALDLLRQLEAIDDTGITPRGRDMVKLPTHPRIAHMLTQPGESGAAKSLACDVAAVLEERDPLDKEAGADLTLRIEALRRWRDGQRVSAERSVLERIERLAANWRRHLKADTMNTLPSDEEVGKLLAAAYPERVARQNSRQGEYYTLTNGLVVKLPSHDPLKHHAWLCAAEVDAGRGEGKIFKAAPLWEGDLDSFAKRKDVITWDTSTGRIVGASERRIGSLLLSSKPHAVITDVQASEVIGAQVKERGLSWLGWGEEEEELQARLMSLRNWRPSEPWPDVRSEELVRTPERWLFPFLAGVRKESELKRLDKSAMLRSLIPWELQSKLDRLAPAHLEVPTGSMIRLRYFLTGEPPVLEVRLQELFGLLDTPVVNEEKVKLVIHLLSPGYKPVQVTQDLRSFWSNAYHEVRKELRRKYPKHSWPDDPFTATPVRGAKRRGG
jgi:ATP-dependent helicase HrpB